MIDRDVEESELPLKGSSVAGDNVAVVVPLPAGDDGVGSVVGAPFAENAAALEAGAPADVQRFIVT